METLTNYNFIRHHFSINGTLNTSTAYQFADVEQGENLLTESLRIDYNDKGLTLNLMDDNRSIKRLTAVTTRVNNLLYIDCQHNEERSLILLELSKCSKKLILSVLKGYYPKTHRELLKIIKSAQET